MSLQQYPHNRAPARFAVAVVLALIGCGMAALASGAVDWALLNRNPRQNAPLEVSEGGPPLGRDGQVIPAAFFDPTDKSPTITLVFANNSPIPADRLTSLNYDDFEKRFKLLLDHFPDADAGGTIEIRTGKDTATRKIRSAWIDPGKSVNEHDPELALKDVIDQGERVIQAVWKPVGKKEASSNLLKLKIDTHGPTLQSVELQGDPDEDPTLVLRFEDDDVKASTVNVHNFVVQRFEEGDQFAEREPITKASLDKTDKRIVRLDFEKLASGVYRIRVVGTKSANDTENVTPLRDNVGNYAGGRGAKGLDQERVFGAIPTPKPGAHIEFPEFQPTAPQPDHPRRINPGDKVETAVVRLYYFRDAHRVAQIVNRTAESLNRAAVELAERRAEDARKKADQLTDERRSNEREAVRLAEELRRMERRAAQAQEAQQLDQRREQIENRLQDLQPPQQEPTPEGSHQGGNAEPSVPANFRSASGAAYPGGALGIPQPQRLPSVHTVARDFQPDNAQPPDQLTEGQLAERRRLQAELQQVRARLRQLGPSALGDVERIGQLEQQLSSVREEAVEANEKALKAQADEDRAREEQFRLEVAAAHEDPDTYAAAKLGSVDPVAQVSISVIGEGLIQLRGPRKGIDRIRTMIEQIDAPVGQVKVEIITVQLNGEKGERMEGPLGRVEAHIGLGRFLTAQSLMLLRAAIQEEATQIALMHDQGGHYQVDRDRKYLYAFFGRDFIDELYEMDSEFLNTQNKILGLHSMDTVSLHQALFILALARNDVRQRILANFMEKVRTHLVQAEFDYRRSAELFPHKTRRTMPHTDRSKPEAFSLEGVALNNQQRYHFRNLLTFFGSLDECSISSLGDCPLGSLGDPTGNTMSPVQREFIRLAQIFKARMITEMELKQRIIERTMIEDDREFNLQEEEQARNSLRPLVLERSRALQQERFDAASTLTVAVVDAYSVIEDSLFLAASSAAEALRLEQEQAATVVEAQEAHLRATSGSQFATKWLEAMENPGDSHREDAARRLFDQELRPLAEGAIAKFRDSIAKGRSLLSKRKSASPMIKDVQTRYENAEAKFDEAERSLNQTENALRQDAVPLGEMPTPLRLAYTAGLASRDALRELRAGEQAIQDYLRSLRGLFDKMSQAADIARFDWQEFLRNYHAFMRLVNLWADRENAEKLRKAAQSIHDAAKDVHLAEVRYNNVNHFLARTRQSLERRKLLDFLIEEFEQKHIDLLEGTRAQIASVDNYLKRLSIALEDDFKVQFYDPAFVRIRRAAREWDVTLSQVERTSILTNNRAFAKVTPAATMEFDLPKRKIAVVEAMEGAKALAQDYGALLQDPTFLSAYELMGGKLNNGKVQGAVPTLPTSTDEYQMGFSQSQVSPTGAALQSLVPDPSVYKFETGTGYEIRPVIQPDGHSIIYDFLYMYTTNVREPVRADEKHLGRVRRHFINTQVQTSSFEVRELSRYQVALKAARTAQGVPLLQDIPVAGALFRPLPSAESSIQQNVILAYSAVYPTLFDLMGLRWAPSVVDLNHVSVRDSEHIVRGRNMMVTDSIFDTSTRTVDDILGIEVDTPEHYRPDLYRRQRHVSPYHPGGYTYPKREPNDDPTGSGFEVPDRRPIETRQPPYDRRFRNPIRYEEIEFQQPASSDQAALRFPEVESQLDLESATRTGPRSDRQTSNGPVEVPAKCPRQPHLAPDTEMPNRSTSSVNAPRAPRAEVAAPMPQLRFVK